MGSNPVWRTTKPLILQRFSFSSAKALVKSQKTEPQLRLCFLSPVIESELHSDHRFPLYDPIMLIFPDQAHTSILADEPHCLRVEQLTVFQLLRRLGQPLTFRLVVIFLVVGFGGFLICRRPLIDDPLERRIGFYKSSRRFVIERRFLSSE